MSISINTARSPPTETLMAIVMYIRGPGARRSVVTGEAQLEFDLFVFGGERDRDASGAHHTFAVTRCTQYAREICAQETVPAIEPMSDCKANKNSLLLTLQEVQH